MKEMLDDAQIRVNQVFNIQQRSAVQAILDCVKALNDRLDEMMAPAEAEKAEVLEV